MDPDDDWAPTLESPIISNNGENSNKPENNHVIAPSTPKVQSRANSINFP